MATQTSKPTKGVSEKFCAADADVTFQSADGVRFYLHRKNLDTHAGGFAPPGFKTQGEVVELTEDSITLDLLFQFIYPQKPPDLETLPFPVLASLAEAAEKYEMFITIALCKIRLKSILPDHVDDILEYAAKHEHLDIIDLIAPVMIGQPLEDMARKMPPYMFVAWAVYHEKWINAHNAIANDVMSRLRCFCNSPLDSRGDQVTASSVLPIIQILRMLHAIQALKNLDVVFFSDNVEVCCNYVKAIIVAVRDSAEAKIKSIPKLSSFYNKQG